MDDERSGTDSRTVPRDDVAEAPATCPLLGHCLASFDQHYSASFYYHYFQPVLCSLLTATPTHGSHESITPRIIRVLLTTHMLRTDHHHRIA